MMASKQGSVGLPKDDILRGLRRVDILAQELGVLVNIAIYGDAALALAFDLRDITRDVDVAIMTNAPALRSITAKIAAEEGWPEDWLNDAVKGFRAGAETLLPFPEFSATQTGLCVVTPAPEYLFAMKCMAMRMDESGSSDINYIRALARIIGVTNAVCAMDIVESFYPLNIIPAKVQFGIEEIMQNNAVVGAEVSIRKPQSP